MKLFVFLVTAVFISSSYSQDNANLYDVQVTLSPIGERLQINASYAVPINICSAYSFITDYEASKNIPGIIDAKIVSRLGNNCLLYTSPSPRDRTRSRMPSSA